MGGHPFQPLASCLKVNPSHNLGWRHFSSEKWTREDCYRLRSCHWGWWCCHLFCFRRYRRPNRYKHLNEVSLVSRRALEIVLDIEMAVIQETNLCQNQSNLQDLHYCSRYQMKKFRYQSLYRLFYCVWKHSFRSQPSRIRICVRLISIKIKKELLKSVVSIVLAVSEGKGTNEEVLKNLSKHF